MLQGGVGACFPTTYLSLPSPEHCWAVCGARLANQPRPHTAGMKTQKYEKSVTSPPPPQPDPTNRQPETGKCPVGETLWGLPQTGSAPKRAGGCGEGKGGGPEPGHRKASGGRRDSLHGPCEEVEADAKPDAPRHPHKLCFKNLDSPGAEPQGNHMPELLRLV